jgi:hypothetical protein
VGTADGNSQEQIPRMALVDLAVWRVCIRVMGSAPKGQRMLSNWTKAFLVWLAGFGAIVAVVASPNYPGDAAAFVCILWTIGGGAILGFAFTIKAIFWLLIPKNEV